MNFGIKYNIETSKFGGCASRGIDSEQTKINANPVKYIVSDICDRNTKKGKFAKQMNA